MTITGGLIGDASGDASDDGSFRVGTVLQSTYRILRALASGGMSEVYLAAHERLPSCFAVKALHRDLVRDKAALSRFRREAEIMSSLRHPNIVQVFDFNVSPTGVPYLVMEFLEGQDLSEYLKDRRRMTPGEVGSVARQIAEALDAAHGRGVVHRDLKPENVVLVPLSGDQHLVKVIDFGISKIRRAKRITANATLLGTPQFMAPEQAQGRRDEVDHRTDQFALAAMCYLLLTGHAPFRDDDPASVLYRIVHHDPEPLAKFVGWPTAGVEAVLRRGMSKRREDRYPTILEFAQALEAAVGALPHGSVQHEIVPFRARAAEVTEVDIRRTKTIRMGLLRRRGARIAALAAAAAAVGVVTWNHLSFWAKGAYFGVRTAVAHMRW